MRARVLAAIVPLLLLAACSLERDSGPGPVPEAGDEPAVVDSGSGPTDDEDGIVDRSDQDALMRDYLQRLADCYTELGFPSTLHDDDGIEVQGSGEQFDAYQAAQETCRARLGPAPNERPYTRQEWGALFDLYTGPVARCVEEQGYAVPEAPSREVWIEEYLAVAQGHYDDEPPWSPYDLVGPQGGPELFEACPYPTGQDVYEHLTGPGAYGQE